MTTTTKCLTAFLKWELILANACPSFPQGRTWTKGSHVVNLFPNGILEQGWEIQKWDRERAKIKRLIQELGMEDDLRSWSPIWQLKFNPAWHVVEPLEVNHRTSSSGGPIKREPLPIVWHSLLVKRGIYRVHTYVTVVPHEKALSQEARRTKARCCRGTFWNKWNLLWISQFNIGYWCWEDLSGI